MHIRNGFAFLLFSILVGCAADGPVDTEQADLTGIAVPICQDKHFKFDYQVPCGGLDHNGSPIYSYCSADCVTDMKIVPPQPGGGPLCVAGDTTCGEAACTKCPGDP